MGNDKPGSLKNAGSNLVMDLHPIQEGEVIKKCNLFEPAGTLSGTWDRNSDTLDF